MTLIALTVNRGFPVLMADILISAKVGAGDIPIPTYVNGSSKRITYEDEHRPLRLEQKLYVINERLCVALGGNVEQMGKFLRRTKAIYDSANFADSDLLKFVNDFSEEADCRDFIAIVVLCSPIDTGRFNFEVRCIGQLRLLNNNLYDKVIAGGSGAKQFLDFINTNPKFESDITDMGGPLSANQSLIAYWLSQEVSRGDSLSNHWGAGFEMIIFVDGKFIKLEEYTVVLFAGKFGAGIELEAAPFSTMMISYQNDVMVVRVFAHDQEKIFLVPSIIDNRETIEVVDIEPRHDTLLLAYILHDVSKGIEYNPATIFPRNKNEFGASPIVFERISDKLRLHIDDRIHNYVLSELNS